MLFFNKVAGVGIFPWLLLKFKKAYFVEHPRATPFVLVKPTQFGFIVLCVNYVGLYEVWILLPGFTCFKDDVYLKLDISDFWSSFLSKIN